MFFKRRSVSDRGQERELLGVSFAPGLAALVSVVWDQGDEIVVPFSDVATIDSQNAAESALSSLVQRYRDGGGSAKGCVLGLGSDDWQVELFELRQGNDLRSTLELEVERVKRFNGAPVKVALAAGARLDEGKHLVGYVNRDVLEERVALAAACGLDVVAVDYEGCAWRRAAPDFDVIVAQQRDSNGVDESVVVCGFSDSNIRARRVDKVQISTVGTRVSEALARLEHDRIVRNATRIAVIGEPAFCDSVQSARGLKGITVERLSCVDVECPPWALAYGLALYGFVEETDGGVPYAF